MKASLIALFCVLSYAAAEAPPLPYASAAAQSAYEESPQSGPYVQQYSHSPEGFNIQSGFEGYLVPSAVGGHSLLPLRDGLEALSAGTGYLKWLKPLSKFGLKIIPKLGALAIGVVVLFLIGGIFTTGICTFTPICTISFLGLGLTKETMRSYLTQDKLSQTTTFVLDAIKKYRELYDNSSNEIDGDKNGLKE